MPGGFTVVHGLHVQWLKFVCCCVCCPQVDLSYFTDDGSDMATLVAGVKIARDIAAKVRPGPVGQHS
jgi:hypothetical protein